jgi:hypothetical protein
MYRTNFGLEHRYRDSDGRPCAQTDRQERSAPSCSCRLQLLAPTSLALSVKLSLNYDFQIGERGGRSQRMRRIGVYLYERGVAAVLENPSVRSLNVVPPSGT